MSNVNATQAAAMNPVTIRATGIPSVTKWDLEPDDVVYLLELGDGQAVGIVLTEEQALALADSITYSTTTSAEQLEADHDAECAAEDARRELDVPAVFTIPAAFYDPDDGTEP